MSKHIIAAAFAALALVSCGQQPAEQKVLARFVPERSDDFVFENNLVAGRLYGQALEGNPTSPGIDLWVKMPGKLVANEWYAEAQKDPNYYHHNHGDGKDCYKVATSLGAGASAPFINGTLQMPATNYRSWEVLEETPDKVVFVLHYPEWEADGVKVALDKKFTISADTYFNKCEDTYTFSGELETLPIAAGIFRHVAQETIESEISLGDSYAIWEHASDQSIEAEDGMIGVAVKVPGAEKVCITDDGTHGICVKNVKSGEPFTYYFGSCWSKADVKTAEDWFNLVKGL